MSVHYKFKSALDFDTITFDGLHISVADLKKAIFQQKRIGKIADFDLQITNAQTKEEYTDDAALIPKNTSLTIARIPLAVQPKKQWEPSMEKSSNVRVPVETERAHVDLSRINGSEEDKINAMMMQSTADYDPTNYQKIRGSNQTGEVPMNYRCFKCHKPGHWIKNCPQIGLNEMAEVKRNTGIPRSFIEQQQNELIQQPVVAPPVEKKQEVPEDLICSICKDLFTDAVMIPCCGSSFCDECVRTALLESEDNECPDCHEKGSSPGSLIPNRFLRNSVNSFKNETGYNRKPASKPKAPIVQPPPPAPVEEKEPPPEEKEESDFEDNITVTVPPAELQCRGAFRDGHINGRGRGEESPRSHHLAAFGEEERSETPTVDENDIYAGLPEEPQMHPAMERHHHMEEMKRRSPRPREEQHFGAAQYREMMPTNTYGRHGGGEYIAAPHGPPPGPHYGTQPPRHNMYPETPYGGNHRVPFHNRIPMTGYPIRGAMRPGPPSLASVYQGVAAKVGPGIIDDPLEAFNRIMREKERMKERRRSRSPDLDHRRPLRRRISRGRSPDIRRPRSNERRSEDRRRKRSSSYSRSSRSSRSRSRSPRKISRSPRKRSRTPRNRTRSRSPSFSISRSRSRSVSPAGRYRDRGPPHNRYNRSPHSRSPPRHRPREHRRNERNERLERLERNERMERNERIERNERLERNERIERNERQDRRDRDDMPRDNYRDKSPYRGYPRNSSSTYNRNRGRPERGNYGQRDRPPQGNTGISQQQQHSDYYQQQQPPSLGYYPDNQFQRYPAQGHQGQPSTYITNLTPIEPHRYDDISSEKELFAEKAKEADQPPVPGLEGAERFEKYPKDSYSYPEAAGSGSGVDDGKSPRDNEGRQLPDSSTNEEKRNEERRAEEKSRGRSRSRSKDTRRNRERSRTKTPNKWDIRRATSKERIRERHEWREQEASKSRRGEEKKRVEGRVKEREEKKHRDEEEEDVKKKSKEKKKRKKEKDIEKKKKKEKRREKEAKEMKKESSAAREKSRSSKVEYESKEVKETKEEHTETAVEPQAAPDVPEEEKSEVVSSNVEESTTPNARSAEEEDKLDISCDLYGDIMDKGDINLDFGQQEPKEDQDLGENQEKNSPNFMRSESILDINPTIDFDQEMEDAETGGRSQEEKKSTPAGVLVTIPEPSKWELDEEAPDGGTKSIPSDATTSSPEHKGNNSKMVTNEVLKRAENALFSRAINAIRPIEIRSINADRRKLYEDEVDVAPVSSVIVKTSPELQHTFQITVPTNSDGLERSVEIKSGAVDVKEKLKMKSSPVRSIKDRLGVKVPDDKEPSMTFTPTLESEIRRSTQKNKKEPPPAKSSSPDKRRSDDRNRRGQWNQREEKRDSKRSEHTESRGNSRDRRERGTWSSRDAEKSGKEGEKSSREAEKTGRDAEKSSRDADKNARDRSGRDAADKKSKDAEKSGKEADRRSSRDRNARDSRQPQRRDEVRDTRQKDDRKGVERSHRRSPERPSRDSKNSPSNTRRRSRSKKRSRSPRKSQTKDKTRERSQEKMREKSREKPRDKSPEKSRERPREKSREKAREKSRDRTREKSRERAREKSRERATREKSRDKKVSSESKEKASKEEVKPAPPPSDTMKKLACDESTFEPDYDAHNETLETNPPDQEAEVKTNPADEKVSPVKETFSPEPLREEKPAEKATSEKIVEKKSSASTSNSSSSDSDSSDGESVSGEHGRKRKKRSKHRKQKRRRASSTESVDKASGGKKKKSKKKSSKSHKKKKKSKHK